MEIVYPPVGIVHNSRHIPDLIADRTERATAIRVAVAMQPRATPHFGTGAVIMSAFAVAALLSETFSLPSTVLLDMLDNAPSLSGSTPTKSSLMSFSSAGSLPEVAPAVGTVG